MNDVHQRQEQHDDPARAYYIFPFWYCSWHIYDKKFRVYVYVLSNITMVGIHKNMRETF